MATHERTAESMAAVAQSRASSPDLIKAAPFLFEALLDMVRAIEVRCGDLCDSHPAVIRARDAIAKAMGNWS